MVESIDRERWPDEVHVRWDLNGLQPDPHPQEDYLQGLRLVGRWLDATTFETTSCSRFQFPPADGNGVRNGFVFYLDPRTFT